MHKNSRVKSDNDFISVSLVTLVTSHQPLIPALKLFGVSLSRIVIESTAEGSFLHCGQYRIGIGRETTTWRYVFLLSHMHCLSVCKEDFSATLEMTIRESPSPLSLVTHPCFQTFGAILFPHRHPERSRGIFLALRLVSHRHWQGNDDLALRISAFTHALFIGLQGRFLASLEMTIREPPSP